MFLAEKYVFSVLASIKKHLHKMILISGGCLTFLRLLDPSDQKRWCVMKMCVEVVTFGIRVILTKFNSNISVYT